MSRIPNHEMADDLSRMVWSKTEWLADFGTGRNKRPDHEIEAQRRNLAVLEQAAGDYRRAAERAA